MLSQQMAGGQARPADRDPPAWYTLPGEAVLAELDTTLAGLDQAAERLARYGRNELPAQEPPTLFQIILHQFQSPLIASDKTGTLTVNEQTVRRVVLPMGEELAVTGAGYAGEGEVTSADGGELAASVRCGQPYLYRPRMEMTG